MPEQAVSLSIVELFRNADIIVKGVLLLLLAGSIWSWAVIVEKLRQFAVESRRIGQYEERAAAARTAAELWGVRGEGEAAGPPGVVLAAAVAEIEAGLAVPVSPAEHRDRIERTMRLALNGEMRRLEKRLPFLATLGSAAPFIGLFGTVWGIMRSFAAIAAANNTSLAVVAPGIAEALFATAMGLAVAIPAVVAYNHFTVQLGRLAARMNAFIGRAGALLSRVSD
jgi:biopolymer transport protein TolQ